MATETENLETLVNRRYEHGFVTEVNSGLTLTEKGQEALKKL